MVDFNELKEYYESHSRSETLKFFNITVKQLYKILKENNYKKPKDLITFKNTRSHESYVQGGLKSKQTQQEHWSDKSQEEKDLWANKCRDIQLNLSEDKKQSMINKTKITNAAKSLEQKLEEKKKKSESCKKFWNSLNKFDKDEKLNSILIKTREVCLEKYGVPYPCMREEARMRGNNSKPNEYFSELLDNFNVNYSREFNLKNKSFDFKISNNLVEIDPTYTHSPDINPFNREPISKEYHYEKSKLARENGFRCIHIFDWDDPVKVVNLLLPRETVYARKCTIKEVDLSTTREYLNTNHLQGYAKDSIRLGLYYNDELVSIMTFGEPRYNKNYEYELVRYCSSYKVLGGAEKLFKYFINNYNPKSIISYCDYSKFNGDTYLKLGFKFKNVSISKHWYNVETGKHITDNLLRQRGFDQLFGTSYGKGTSNEQLMIENGFVEVYDAGQAVYTLERT